MVVARSAPPLVGQVLAGKYRVERVLGRGGMGVVVAATHLDLQELRAVKLMHPEYVGNARAVERFLMEARAAVRLKSEHVAAVLDVGRLPSGAPYIVMEHLAGSDLGRLTKQRGHLAIEEAALYVAQAARGVAEAHAAGIVHRDLKPSNLFLTTARDGSPCIKVLDFGISKMVRPEGDAPLDVTHTREMMGSPLYMAPEQMRTSHLADARSDVWGLGVILYKLVTGKLPFFAHGLLELCTVVLERPPVPPSALRPDLPADLEALILRCLAKDPAQRPGSAAEVAAALAPFAEQRGSAERISVELLDAPEAPASVGARTTSPDTDEVDAIPVDFVEEPDGAAPIPLVRAPEPRRPPRPRARRPIAPRRRKRGALAAVAAVALGIFGSVTSLAATGALVSQDQSAEAPPPRPSPALAAAAAARLAEEIAEPPPPRPRPVAPTTCPVAPEKRTSTIPGGPDDPFRLSEPSAR